MTVDLLHKVEGHADRDKQARAAVETRDLRRDAQGTSHDRGDDRHERQERGAHVGDPLHHPLQKVGRALARPVAGDEGPKILEIIGHLLGVEGDRRPEVAEEVDQHDIEHVVEKRLAPRERVVQRPQHGTPRIGIVQILEDHLREKQQ